MRPMVGSYVQGKQLWEMHQKNGYASMFMEVSDQNTTKSLIPWARKPLKVTTNLKAMSSISEIYYKTQK